MSTITGTGAATGAQTKEGALDGVFSAKPRRFTHEEAEVFYRGLGRLLTYANSKLGVVGAQDITLHTRDKARQADGARVSERLWLNRSLVDDYVRENPYGADEEELQAVSPWRHALRDVFIALDAEDDHALYMNADAVFCVNRLEARACRSIRSVPSLALLTLLPYKGVVVTDTKFIRLRESMDEPETAEILETARTLAQKGVVARAEALVAYAGALPDENRVSEYWQLSVDKKLGLPHVRGCGAVEHHGE